MDVTYDVSTRVLVTERTDTHASGNAPTISGFILRDAVMSQWHPTLKRYMQHYQPYGHKEVMYVYTHCDTPNALVRK